MREPGVRDARHRSAECGNEAGRHRRRGGHAHLLAEHGAHGELTPRAAQARTLAWQPWRSYAVLRLWNSLETST